MKVVGIICEYNPLHLGHRKQILRIREEFGEETCIVCAMSGNFVQRGSPAIIDKSIRAQAAVACGADLVLELPVTRALSSAEGFAAGGVKLLSPLCDTLCFGAETANREILMDAARALLSDDFPPLLRIALDTGKSFPAAREDALKRMGVTTDILSQPNNILAVEYCKAILTQDSPMTIFPIHRQGSYHALSVDAENPSATAVRNLMLIAHNWKTCVPQAARDILEGAGLHSTAAGEKAVLARLRTMSDADFEALPYGSEGLWRKLMHACRRENTLEEILTSTKSRRYTRSRLDRMVMCAVLGITAADLAMEIPYTRVLAFSGKGRVLLNTAKKQGTYLNAGEAFDHPYWQLEKRCGDLYGLFSVEGTEPPGAEENRRIYYQI
ncbi:MAG: nucleotidyltransferase family protein [Oscillospiraceae bacterium]|nr:nucleotidyltransferase family protein [Oscillospiraceae bacterium]MBQ7130744.1 nucleotidyltransferase family protein [Oscillospiraceae bacterium]